MSKFLKWSAFVLALLAGPVLATGFVVWLSHAVLGLDTTDDTRGLILMVVYTIWAFVAIPVIACEAYK